MPADAGDKPVPVRPANEHPEFGTIMTVIYLTTTQHNATHYTLDSESSIQESSEILL